MKMTKSMWFGLIVGAVVSFLIAMAFYRAWDAWIAFIIVPIGAIMGVAPQLLKPLDDDE